MLTPCGSAAQDAKSGIGLSVPSIGHGKWQLVQASDEVVATLTDVACQHLGSSTCPYTMLGVSRD